MFSNAEKQEQQFLDVFKFVEQGVGDSLK